MNIVFFTQDDPFYVKIFFDEFFKSYAHIDEIKAVVISRSMAKKSNLKLAAQMYNFFGFYNFLRVGSQYAYVKAMGKKKIKKSGNGSIPKTYTVRQLASAYGIDVIERSDLNSRDFQQLIKQYDADLFISIASSIIFKKDLINIPKLDCINIHNAPLPNYRGMLPNFWQLYHGETHAGITVHRIEVGIDTGDIVSQQSLPIEPDESLDDLIVKTKKEDAKIIMKVIEGFRNGETEYRKMEGEGSYFTFPGKNDAIEFKQRGKRIF